MTSFQIFLKEGLLQTFSRLKVLDFRSNPIVCDEFVAKFFRLTQTNPDLEVQGWNNGTGYVCRLENNLTEITYKEYFDQYVWDDSTNPSSDKWASGFLLGSVSMFGLASFVCYNIYQKRFYINYFFLLRRRKLMEKRDPELDYTYDVFVSYSQVICLNF